MASTNTITMSFRVDKKLKKDADDLFKNLGINMSVALNMFLKHCVREQEIPFKISMKKKEPSKELLEALQEGEDIVSGKVPAKSYTNMYEMIEDLKE